MICIEDIAHALSLICRGNGQVKTFFSVGQHCINCAREALARGYSRRVAFACLLHDASECYLSDVPRPFKKTLSGYKEQDAFNDICAIPDPHADRHDRAYAHVKQPAQAYT